MSIPFFLFATALLPLALAAAGTDVLQDERLRLEGEWRELAAKVRDPGWMQTQGRATLTRLRLEQGWKECAANEGAMLAKASNKPAKLLADEAVARCAEWERLLGQSLNNGAYPYLGAAPAGDSGYRSREDMIALAERDAREAAQSRILLWRSDERVGVRYRTADGAGRMSGLPAPPAEASPPPVPPAAETAPGGSGEAEEEIVIVAERRGRCRVRLADRTLTDAQLAANAAAWAANRTHLRVVRPRGADYDCLARIVFRLGQHGVRLFHFVDRPGSPPTSAN